MIDDEEKNWICLFLFSRKENVRQITTLSLDLSRVDGRCLCICHVQDLSRKRYEFSYPGAETYRGGGQYPNSGGMDTQNPEPSEAWWRQIEQGFSSFFAIFDDFSKFRSTFCALNFEKSSTMGKIWQKIKKN